MTTCSTLLALGKPRALAGGGDGREDGQLKVGTLRFADVAATVAGRVVDVIIGMVKSGGDGLSRQDLATSRAMLAFCQTRLGTGSFNGSVGNLGVRFHGYHGLRR